MNARLLAAVIRTPPAADGTDADLLRRYLAGKDDAAFAELVRRYSQLVWSVCRNSLGREADAEEAFQAVFLALARNAKQVRDGRAVGGWLHGVAVRVCLKLKRGEARRSARQRAAANGETEQPVADSRWDAVLAAVHVEVADLPEIYRVPFVLCCLEGRGATEAAEQLGWKLGTLSGRLTRAKQQVLDRLAARGLTPAVAGLAVAVSAADAPARLVHAAAGLPGGAIPIAVLTLARGATEVAVVKKLMAAAVVLSGLGVGWHAAAEAQSSATRPAPAAAPADAVLGSGPVPGRTGSGLASARAATLPGGSGTATSERWQYKFIDEIGVAPNAKDGPAAVAKLAKDAVKDTISKHGDLGWEYVGILPGTTGDLVFKRPANQGPARYTSGSAPAPAMGPGSGGFGAAGNFGTAVPGAAYPGVVPSDPNLRVPSSEPFRAAGVQESPRQQILQMQSLNAAETAEVLKKLYPTLTTATVATSNVLILRGSKTEIDSALAFIDELEVRTVKNAAGGGGPKKP